MWLRLKRALIFLAGILAMGAGVGAMVVRPRPVMPSTGFTIALWCAAVALSCLGFWLIGFRFVPTTRRSKRCFFHNRWSLAANQQSRVMPKEQKLPINLILATMLLGAIAGALIFVALLARRLWESHLFHAGIGAVLGAVVAGVWIARNTRRLVWNLLFGTLAGAIIGASIRNGMSNYALVGAVAGMVLGLVCGVILELQRSDNQVKNSEHSGR